MSEEGKNIFYAKRSATGSVKRQIHLIVNEIPMSIDNAYETLVYYFVDDDVISSWTDVLNELKVDKSNIRLTPDGEEMGMYLPEPIRKEFVRYFTMQASKLITEKFDTTTRLLMRGSIDADNQRNWFLKWPQCIISNFKEIGCYGCIEGVPRTGKTSMACTFMPMFHEFYDLDILTNIKIDDAPDYIYYTQKLSDLVKLMDERNQWICILDETATFAYKKLALKTENIDFETLGRFIGKMGGRLLMITHSIEMDVPTQLQTWMTERYKKLEKKRMKIDLAGANYKAHDIINNIPDTELNFVTADITSLQFDVSIEKLLQRVQDGVSVEEALNEQIAVKKNKEKVILDKQEKKEEMNIIVKSKWGKAIAIKKKYPGITDTDLAKEAGYAHVESLYQTKKRHGGYK